MPQDRKSSLDFLAAKAGNVAVMVALGLPFLIGSAGFGIETSYWYFKSLELQGAADSAAWGQGTGHTAQLKM